MKSSKWPSPGSDGDGAPNGDHLLARDRLTEAGSSAFLTKENFDCSPVSGIRYPVSGIRYPVSGIRYPVSGMCWLWPEVFGLIRSTATRPPQRETHWFGAGPALPRRLLWPVANCPQPGAAQPLGLGCLFLTGGGGPVAACSCPGAGGERQQPFANRQHRQDGVRQRSTRNWIQNRGQQHRPIRVELRHSRHSEYRERRARGGDLQ